MSRGIAHLVQHLLKVEQGATAAGAGHVFDHRLAQAQRLKNRVANWDFPLWSLGERHPDGVTEPIGKQGCDPSGALDAAVITISGLRHPEMQRVMETLPIHGVGHQAVRRQHHRSAGGLHGNHDVVKVEVIADAHEFHRRLDHSLGGVAVGEQHPFGEGAVVDTDAESLVLIPQQGDEWLEGFADAGSDGGEFLV